MKQTTKVIIKIERETVNRGTKLFLVSTNGKGYFANEVGELTEISKVIGGDQRYAHRLNPSVRYGNQYTRSWKVKPFTTIPQAMAAIDTQANTNVRYC